MLSFQAFHHRNDDVHKAYSLLVEKRVLVERPEKQWELPAIYAYDEDKAIYEALILLQETKILDVKPVNWHGTENAVELLVDKEEIFPRALEMIARARRTIRFNIFLWGGEIGLKMVKALEKAKDRVVSVCR